MTMPVDLRPSVSAYLGQRLAAFREGFRHNLALLGAPGSGKSHVVKQALRAADRGLLRVYCPLERMSLAEFSRRFAVAVLQAATDQHAEASLDRLLEAAQARTPKTAEAVRHVLRPAPGALQGELLAQTLDLVPIAHEELGRPCVLVFDEFLHLDELGAFHAFRELGKRVVTWPFAMFVVTSSTPVIARDILRERLQLLFGQFELLTLGPMEASSAVDWMQQQLPGLEHRADLAHFLFSWAGDCPWYLQVMVRRMKEVALLSRQPSVTEATMIQAAWDVLGSRHGALHQWCVAKLGRLLHHRHGSCAREALVLIAGGARTTQAIRQQVSGRRQLTQALQVLVDDGLVDRRGVCWVIPDQVFGFWLGTAGRAAQTDGLLTDEQAAARVREAMGLAWLRWQKATRASLAERISELLLQFDNETVSLDHRTGRLPSFRTMNATRPGQLEETYILAEGRDQRWCCLVHEGKLEEARIAAFDHFCHLQSPRPSRKVVVAKDGLELNAKLLAKQANMWVWEPSDVRLLSLLYGQPGARS